MVAEDRPHLLTEQYEKGAEGRHVGAMVTDPPEDESSRQAATAASDRLGVSSGLVAEFADGGEELGCNLHGLGVVRPGRRELYEHVGHPVSLSAPSVAARALRL